MKTLLNIRTDKEVKFVKPLSKRYKKNNLYYGTMRIEVPKGTDVRHQVFGWLQAALKDITPAVQSMERKWISLAETPRPVNLPNYINRP